MKSFSGRFVIRLDPAFHEKLVLHASGRGMSLNQVCTDFLKQGLTAPSALSQEEKAFQKIAGVLKRRFGDSLLGIVLFGSRVEGKTTDQSDWDLLIVLAEDLPIKRSLYSWWDGLKIDFKSGTVNPHFVHLPQVPDSAGGLWLEVALHHKIIYEQEGKLSSELQKIFQMIQQGKVIRHFSNGHPYWVRRENAQS